MTQAKKKLKYQLKNNDYINNFNILRVKISIKTVY